MTHLILDGLAGHEALLRDKGLLSAYVKKLVRWLNMKIMAGPLVVEDTRIGEMAGITAVAVISESHIAIHTWPRREEWNVNVDVFSCRPFDCDAILRLLQQDWQMVKESHVVLERPLGDGVER
ncbi:MAG: S-adenosylmethionine decarboxylase [Rhodospirillaceae bacterium]|nr:MAG: S-adenosylmethionine decarboxylase [Rhodospirillaceae bacterium]